MMLGVRVAEIGKELQLLMLMKTTDFEDHRMTNLMEEMALYLQMTVKIQMEPHSDLTYRMKIHLEEALTKSRLRNCTGPMFN